MTGYVNRFFLIYKITNLTNGKVYIGKHMTFDPNDGYMGSGKLLKRAISKYGIENFRKEVLFECSSEEEMNSKEAELVTEDFCARDDTYNLCPGGQGGWGYINSLSEHKDHIRSGARGMNKTLWARPEFRAQKINEASNRMKPCILMERSIIELLLVKSTHQKLNSLCLKRLNFALAKETPSLGPCGLLMELKVGK